jgi:hypothetical protein
MSEHYASLRSNGRVYGATGSARARERLTSAVRAAHADGQSLTSIASDALVSRDTVTALLGKGRQRTSVRVHTFRAEFRGVPFAANSGAWKVTGGSDYYTLARRRAWTVARDMVQADDTRAVDLPRGIALDLEKAGRTGLAVLTTEPGSRYGWITVLEEIPNGASSALH